MKKLIYLILIVLLGCMEKVERDHLDFKNDISSIEHSILTIDSLLPNFPEQMTANRIQSFYYDVIEKDTILNINADPIGEVHKLSIDTLSKVLNFNQQKTKGFLNASMILLRNNITACVVGVCGWEYVYKLSNNRGQYRPVLYNYSPSFIQYRLDSCEYEIIDKKGKIILFKTKELPIPIPRESPDTLSEFE